jgi:hypothetical protein
MDPIWCCVVVVLIIAGIVAFAARTRAKSANHLDESLPPGVDDDGWLREGDDRYRRLVGRHYGSPETIAAGGWQRLQAQDYAAALFFFQKAIDLLHSLYVINERRRRRPTERDLPVIDAYLDTLAAIRDERPTAPVASSVQEVTHRLRTIATACQDAGLDPSRYIVALTRLGQIAPDVDVSGTLWRNPTLDEVLRGDDEVDHG